MEPFGRFHHIGLACADMASEIPELAALGYAAEGDAIEDPIQKVAVRFFTGGGPRIELVTPLTLDSPVQGVLKRGTKLYHLAYEASQIESAMTQLGLQGYRALSRPVPAVAFHGRRIVFMMSARLNLVELIEAESALR